SPPAAYFTDPSTTSRRTVRTSSGVSRPVTPAAARTSSYQSDATTAAKSPYLSVRAGTNSSSASLAASGLDKSKPRQNWFRSDTANDTRRRCILRSASTSAREVTTQPQGPQPPGRQVPGEHPAGECRPAHA